MLRTERESCRKPLQIHPTFIELWRRQRSIAFASRPRLLKFAALLKGKPVKTDASTGAGQWSWRRFWPTGPMLKLAISWRSANPDKQCHSHPGFTDQDLWPGHLNYARAIQGQSLANFRALREANLALLKISPAKALGHYAPRGPAIKA